MLSARISISNRGLHLKECQALYDTWQSMELELSYYKSTSQLHGS